MEVRIYKDSDLPDIIEISKDIWEGNDYLPERIGEFLADPHSHPCVIELDNKVVSVGNMRFINKDTVWLEALRTHPEFREQGLAKTLTSEFFKLGKTMGAKQAWLMTSQSNLATQHILEDLKFAESHLISLCGFIEEENLPEIKEDGTLSSLKFIDNHISDEGRDLAGKWMIAEKLDPLSIIYSEFLAYPSNSYEVLTWIESKSVYSLPDGSLMTILDSRERDNQLCIGVTTNNPLVLEAAAYYVNSRYSEVRTYMFYPNEVRHTLFHTDDWIFRLMIREL
jgi:ribosomal protein S18 acetylase RimI-like enzyme